MLPMRRSFSASKNFCRILQLPDCFQFAPGFLVLAPGTFVFIKFHFGVIFGSLPAYPAGIGQHPPFVESQEFIPDHVEIVKIQLPAHC